MKFLIIFCLVIVSLFTKAQPIKHCPSPPLYEDLKKIDPAYELHRFENENLFQKSITPENKESLADSPIITIPVVVHILYNQSIENISDEQIRSQITVLNEDYRKKYGTRGYNTNPVGADARIEFALAVRDSQGNNTNGITRTHTSKTFFKYDSDEAMKYSSKGGINPWSSSNYLNIWVCNLVNYLGYATYPGSPSVDGVVIGYRYFGNNTGTTEAPYNLGRTATHEIGHWLGLLHTWGDSDCGSDYVDDTPPTQQANYDCPKGKTSTCNGNTTPDMIENYLDFTDDACMNIFTKGQVSRMRTTLNGIRKPIKNSNALTPVATGIDQKNMNSSDINFYPNPAANILHIDLNNKKRFEKIMIYNSLGQEMIQLKNNFTPMTLDISSYPNGLYLIHTSNPLVLPMKLIVSH